MVADTNYLVEEVVAVADMDNNSTVAVEEEHEEHDDAELDAGDVESLNFEVVFQQHHCNRNHPNYLAVVAAAEVVVR